MKTFLLWSVMLSLIVGCASPNPNFNPAQPPSATNPPNIPNKTVTTIVDTGTQIAPVVPPPYNTILLAGLGLATAVAGIFAKVKNDQATASAATTSQIAASVAAQGPLVEQAVTDHASNSPQATPVFAAINAKLPPDKISTT